MVDGTGDPGVRAEKLMRAYNAAQQQTEDRPIDGCREACSREDTTWIELELVGEDGVAVADEEFLVVTADGEELRGKTDANGLARLEGIADGDCSICFPALDRDAWDKQ